VSEKPVKPANWIESVNCAIEGILWATKSQPHLRWHFLGGICVLLAAVFFKVSVLELILLIFAIVLVLFAELINTAVEVVVDMVSPDYHPLAKRAKDVAAGSVLVSSIGAAVMGYLALSQYLLPPMAEGLRLLRHPPGEVSVIAVLAVTVLVVLTKARFSHGTPLHGGMPSGHAAVAFSIATSIAVSEVSLVIVVMALLLATMVSHSRLLMKIHTMKEVLIGAAIGIIFTLLIHLVF